MSGTRRASTRRVASNAKIKQEEEDSEDKNSVPQGTVDKLQSYAFRPTGKRKDYKPEETPEEESKPLPKKRKALNADAASPRKKQKTIQMELDKPHPEPANWRAVYEKIERMRSQIIAPVDTMGCHTPMLEEGEPRTQRFTTLISLMLSSQTKDEVTSAAIQNLRALFGGHITLEAILEAKEEAIAQAICKVGFWRRKAGYIKQTAVMLRDRFDSDVPKTVDDLCSLPGVGPKMAFLCLQSAWDVNVGIGVDVHVHRITNRLGWHKPPTATPEQTRLNLQSWLPRDLHGAINPLLVGFGQTICLPVGPRCDECTLSVGKLCPSAKVGKLASPRKGRAIQAGPRLEIKLEGTGDVDVQTDMTGDGPTIKSEPGVKEEPDTA